MEFVEWNDSFSVGNALMDAHHQVFFRMVKEFSESPAMDDPDAMMKRIAFLVEYTAMHLGAEEKLMQQADCPGFEQHRKLHAAFAHQVMFAKEAFFKDQESLTPDQVLEMMQDWFLHHILGEDKKYMPFVLPRT